MAFDGIFLHGIINELREAEQCHIDKIYQPSRDELVFLLRKKGFAKRLLLCVKAGAARVQFTDDKFDNPDYPPMLCMLVRKRFSGAKLVSVSQRGFDRIAEFCFETTNEMGDRVTPKIVCELMGNKSNIIFVDSNGRIIDAVHRSDIENSDRIIQSGAVYKYPPCDGKISPASNTELLLEKIFSNSELPLDRAVLNSVEGVSPLVSREISRLSLCGGIVRDCNKSMVRQALEKFKNYIENPNPTMLNDSENIPTEFSYMPISQYGDGYNAVDFNSLSALLDAFYSERRTADFIKHRAADIIKLVTNLKIRAQKRKALRETELEGCKDKEKLHIFGELIKANIHNIPSGAKSVTVQNFYDENFADITVPLDPSISAAANASRYFKNYKKAHTAEQLLGDLISDDEKEIVYFDSVLYNIEKCNTASEIAEIRDELQAEGYLKAQKIRKKTAKMSPFLEFTSVEGYRIAVGKNNLQNDLLTLKTASKSDLWFHVKGIAGSHVVVFCGGKAVSDQTLVYAATLAAENSKASSSSKVAVDYTPVKFVKKPNGAKAGMVIYTTNKTLIVTPREVEKR